MSGMQLQACWLLPPAFCCVPECLCSQLSSWRCDNITQSHIKAPAQCFHQAYSHHHDLLRPCRSICWPVTAMMHVASSAVPSGLQHERSAKRLHSRLHRCCIIHAAEFSDWDASAAEVLLLQQLVLRPGKAHVRHQQVDSPPQQDATPEQQNTLVADICAQSLPDGYMTAITDLSSTSR